MKPEIHSITGWMSVNFTPAVVYHAFLDYKEVDIPSLSNTLEDNLGCKLRASLFLEISNGI